MRAAIILERADGSHFESSCTLEKSLTLEEAVAECHTLALTDVVLEPGNGYARATIAEVPPGWHLEPA